MRVTEVAKSIESFARRFGRYPRYCMVCDEEYDAIANEFSAGWLGNMIVSGVPIYRFGEVVFNARH